MKCCIPGCLSDSGKQGEGLKKVSFHMFPADKIAKQSWILAINREVGWSPTKYTKICALHFEDRDIFKSKKGLNQIRAGALPKLMLKLNKGVSLNLSIHIIELV